MAAPASRGQARIPHSSGPRTHASHTIVRRPPFPAHSPGNRTCEAHKNGGAPTCSHGTPRPGSCVLHNKPPLPVRRSCNWEQCTHGLRKTALPVQVSSAGSGRGGRGRGRAARQPARCSPLSGSHASSSKATACRRAQLPVVLHVQRAVVPERLARYSLPICKYVACKTWCYLSSNSCTPGIHKRACGNIGARRRRSYGPGLRRMVFHNGAESNTVKYPPPGVDTSRQCTRGPGNTSTARPPPRAHQSAAICSSSCLLPRVGACSCNPDTRMHRRRGHDELSAPCKLGIQLAVRPRSTVEIGRAHV